MSSISIVGAGHLTVSLLEGLACVSKIPIMIFNRTPERLKGLLNCYPNLIPVDDIADLAAPSAFILMIIPAEAIIELAPRFIENVRRNGSILVSCSVVLTHQMLNERFPGVKIVRIFPNINWRIGQGVTPIIGNELVDRSDLEELARLLGSVSMVHIMDDEETFDRLGMLCSCGPGLVSEIVKHLCAAFGIDDRQEKKLVYQMVRGAMGTLIHSGKTPDEMLSEIATSKKSLTREGVESLAELLPANLVTVFNRMSDKAKQNRAALT
ncbi:MAG: NAD(P)-binding domain-containing protein [Anaerolineales bacterium]|nr:NAD(P)-binding domain-containing protein [Anaerolineales bacterium]